MTDLLLKDGGLVQIDVARGCSLLLSRLCIYLFALSQLPVLAMLSDLIAFASVSFPPWLEFTSQTFALGRGTSRCECETMKKNTCGGVVTMEMVELGLS